jgi:hypothetical protein
MPACCCVFLRQCPIEPIARNSSKSPSAVDPRSADRLPVSGSRDAPVRRRAAPDLVAPVLSIVAKRFDKQIVFPWVRARQEKGWQNAARGFANAVAPSPAWLLSRAPTGARGRALSGLTSAIFLGQIAAPFAYDPLVRVFGSGNTFLSVGVASLLIVLSVRALSGRALATSG